MGGGFLQASSAIPIVNNPLPPPPPPTGLDLKVTAADLAKAVQATAASVAPQTIAEYEAWNKEFASV